MALVHENEEVRSHEDMVGAFALLYHHLFSFIKPMALKCVVDLGIPDAIHRRGCAATVSCIAADTGVHATRIPDLRCLMKLLTTSGLFGAATTADGEVVYTLTAASSLVVGPRGLSNIVRFVAGPVSVTPFLDMPAWLRTAPAPDAPKSPFELTHGRSRWDPANADDDTMNDAAFAESQLLIEAVLSDHGDVFRGLTSLVDVGGGHGSFAKAVATAFPNIKCAVMDLPHVVADAPIADGSVQFVAGNMFESIPPADAVLLKYVLHCWGEDDCVKILRRCKDAIPARDAGGKVIITEMVLGSGPRDRNVAETEEMHSLFLTCISGVGREEHEWKKIFSDAGFSDYKITPVMGPISVIEVYP
ncbi:acetylserotonin O-methyltransferase 3-like [Phragmites australis]|uniref:acetylserotonin O-methyltransferase 3-like n=1 Tax=Phragmites australis TaxID=29695 RepID=UPI002D77F48E|nr:acetylserotonin O-methyltransferase 3-like [Phragmites australis]